MLRLVEAMRPHPAHSDAFPVAIYCQIKARILGDANWFPLVDGKGQGCQFPVQSPKRMASKSWSKPGGVRGW